MTRSAEIQGDGSRLLLKHDADAAWQAAIAAPPTPNASGSDTEQPSDEALREVDRAKHPVKFRRA